MNSDYINWKHWLVVFPQSLCLDACIWKEGVNGILLRNEKTETAEKWNVHVLAESQTVWDLKNWQIL